MINVIIFLNGCAPRTMLSIFVALVLLLAAPAILGVARDDSFSVDKLAIVSDAEKSAIFAGDTMLMAIKSDLHRNIQDVFNEYGVQIMSPAYETDPQTLKIVPPEDWYASPATKPE